MILGATQPEFNSFVEQAQTKVIEYGAEPDPMFQNPQQAHHAIFWEGKQFQEVYVSKERSVRIKASADTLLIEETYFQEDLE